MAWLDNAWLVSSYTSQFMISWLDWEMDANDTSCHKQIRMFDPNLQDLPWNLINIRAAFGRFALEILCCLKKIIHIFFNVLTIFKVISDGNFHSC